MGGGKACGNVDMLTGGAAGCMALLPGWLPRMPYKAAGSGAGAGAAIGAGA